MSRQFQFGLWQLILFGFVLSTPFSWPVSHPVVLVATMILWLTAIFALINQNK